MIEWNGGKSNLVDISNSKSFCSQLIIYYQHLALNNHHPNVALFTEEIFQCFFEKKFNLKFMVEIQKEIKENLDRLGVGKKEKNSNSAKEFSLIEGNLNDEPFQLNLGINRCFYKVKIDNEIIEREIKDVEGGEDKIINIIKNSFEKEHLSIKNSFDFCKLLFGEKALESTIVKLEILKYCKYDDNNGNQIFESIICEPLFEDFRQKTNVNLIFKHNKQFFYFLKFLLVDLKKKSINLNHINLKYKIKYFYYI